MAHIHAQIDYVVSAFITHPIGGVLLVDHKKLNGWYPVGGHIELDEDPDTALDREIWEETGLHVGMEVEIYQENDIERRWPGGYDRNHARPLRRPWYMEIHNFPPIQDHRHVAMIYLARSSALKVTLERQAHHKILWFDHDDIDDPQYSIANSIRWYCHQAIDKFKQQEAELCL